MAYEGLPLSLPAGTSKRKSIKEILGLTDPEDQAIYDEALASGEAARTRDETRALDNLFGNFQSRGLAKSGLAFKSATEDILGPSQERARSLASTFGLERARGRSGLLQNLGLGEFDYGGEADLQNLGYLQNRELTEFGEALARKREAEARKARRRSGLGGLVGGGIGALLSKTPAGAYAGSTAGSGLF